MEYADRGSGRQGVQEVSCIVNHHLLHVFRWLLAEGERHSECGKGTVGMTYFRTTTGEPFIFLLIGEFIDFVLRPATKKDSTRLCRKGRSEEHTSELQSLRHLVCRLL